MEDIAKNYGAIYHDFNIIYLIAKVNACLHTEVVDLESIKNEIEDCLDKAQKYDELRYKQSQGGRKSASNMTKEERIARARKAGRTK
ncbi:MAG: hypothetical protein J6S67_02220 [Methanobrevibacter sp.]|nr:hypothetical protein [Methanobrevibacter sp.]